MLDFEKLGSFYLGKGYDPASRTRSDRLVLYDARDLVTHAVIVGMTGSGKTGLGIAILEEAAIDGVPSIVIDPKGDLANLLLTFPGLQPQDFRPWINEEEAARKGLSTDQLASQHAARWTDGLREWGEDGARIQRLRDAAEFAVYTPGSTAGRPVSILKSLDAPPPGALADAESLRERIATTASGLLGLVGADTDPIRSREHILLSTLLDRAWSQGKPVDLAMLIAQIQQPPVTRVGVMDLESFFPAKDRFGLAMALNGLLASPSFGAWMEGEPLDIGRLLYTSAGKPRVAVFSIAHLADAERMFFVSILLNQVLGWTRAQSGTTSLRALVYMDEIAGYFPPVANPPSKPPLMTLMKQARAFGVGVVLATQNPVDIDYKGLANAGTWFIGRLQTERDKARVLDGLEGASAAAGAAFARSDLERLLSQLDTRVFLMNNVHEDHPEVFETRWTLSYLCGPLTRAQIRALGRHSPDAEPAAAAIPSASKVPQPPARSAEVASARPVLPPDVPQYFIPVRSLRPAGASLEYRAMVLGSATVAFSDAKAGVDASAPSALLAQIIDGPVALDWLAARGVDIGDGDLLKGPEGGARFAEAPAEAAKPKNYDAWRRTFADAVLRTSRLDLLRSAAMGEVSRPGEDEAAFRARLAQAARERRDALTETLRRKYAPKLSTLQERLRRAQQQVQVQEAQARDAKWSTAMSFGSAILGAFLGRKVASAGNVGKAATAMRGVGRSMREGADVGRAEETAAAVEQQLKALESEFQAEVESGAARLDPAAEPLERITLRAKRTGVNVRAVVLAWAPFWIDPAGVAVPAWE